MEDLKWRIIEVDHRSTAIEHDSKVFWLERDKRIIDIEQKFIDMKTQLGTSDQALKGLTSDIQEMD